MCNVVVTAGCFETDDGEGVQDNSVLSDMQLRQSNYRTNHIALCQVPI